MALCLLGGVIGGTVAPMLLSSFADPERPPAAGVLRTSRIELVDGRGPVNAIFTAALPSTPAALFFVNETGQERLRLGFSAGTDTPALSITGHDNKR